MKCFLILSGITYYGICLRIMWLIIYDDPDPRMLHNAILNPIRHKIVITMMFVLSPILVPYILCGMKRD